MNISSRMAISIRLHQIDYYGISLEFLSNIA